MPKLVAADIVILGGGIAGLWLLNRLKDKKVSVLLCETDALGSGQTNQSQGIIHGGLKYALQGVLKNETQVLVDVPAIWQACLSGNGIINLTDVPILSSKQYLWGPNALSAKFAGFLAKTALTSKVDALKREDYPKVFQHAQFKGKVFALDELVLNVPLLIKSLAKNCMDHMLKINSFTEDAFQFDADQNLTSITTTTNDGTITIQAKQFIFTAGAGNEIFFKKINEVRAMQRRPLHMVLAKTDFHLPLYAHCLGVGARPRITITTHYREDGAPVWYLGGALAEEGVSFNQAEQTKAAKKELSRLFPWLNFDGTEFKSFIIDRAEPFQQHGFKPESSSIKSINNVMVAWPTKLALAPKLAEDILANLNFDALGSCEQNTNDWLKPKIATPIWERLFCEEHSLEN